MSNSNRLIILLHIKAKSTFKEERKEYFRKALEVELAGKSDGSISFRRDAKALEVGKGHLKAAKFA